MNGSSRNGINASVVMHELNIALKPLQRAEQPENSLSVASVGRSRQTAHQASAGHGLKSCSWQLGFAAVFSAMLSSCITTEAVDPFSGLSHSFGHSFIILWGSNAMAIPCADAFHPRRGFQKTGRDAQLF